MRTSILILAGLFAPAAPGQDLYETTILRNIELTFQQANWQQLLRQNYFSQTYIVGDLTLDGVTYPDVGVRIRGNTSYLALPPGSEKFSLAVEMDHVNPGQDLLGYDTLNLNNAFTDPTFCREVAMQNFMARYVPCGRANHVTVSINGEDWGVYCNVQQYDKTLLREWFEDEDGLRFKCANTPNGPGLRYVGTNPASYSQYEIKTDGGLLDPVGAIIDLCDAVTNGSQANWREIDEVFAVDPSTWEVALENLLTDDDSYVNKGCDFVCYRNPVDGRTHLHQTDGNEAWREPQWPLTRNFTSATKPILRNVLGVPELRQRYMAHMRTISEDFDWAHLEPEFTAYRNLIDAAVQADPKKLYSYQAFQQNFTMNVTIGGGPFGGTIYGLEQFVNLRGAVLAASAELNAPAPEIAWTMSTPSDPTIQDNVYITARVDGPSVPVDGVDLFYLATPGAYERTEMFDDGMSGDGAAGDGVYGTLLPVQAQLGQVVSYYVQARSANAFGSLSFAPTRTELEPATVAYALVGGGMKITEYMYSGSEEEYVEFTNTSLASIDMDGWSFDDQSGVAGTVDLSAAGVVAPGESVVLTQADPAVFASNWGLSGVTVLGPYTATSLGRNDEIHLFDDTGALVDRLAYGDQDFPGSARAREQGAQGCDLALGADDPYLWTLAEVGDAWGAVMSANGDVGSPGSYVAVTCPSIGTTYCMANANTTGSIGSMSATGSSFVAANNLTLRASNLPQNQFGLFVTSNMQDFVPMANGTSNGNLCLGGTLGRYQGPGQVMNTGATGEFSLAIDVLAVPQGGATVALMPGDTQYFQAWHRDTVGMGSNFTQGLEITFN